MNKLRTLLVKFENELKPHEVSAFRGAVIEKVGRENILFNHHIDDKQYLFKYPLIQYKSIHRQPAILCLGVGVDEIHKLFNQKTWIIDLKGKKTELKIDKLDLANFSLQINSATNGYKIENWIGLNQNNHKTYNSLRSEIDQTEMLERILIGNILSFAKGIDWKIEDQIKLRIQNITSKIIKYKNTPLQAFNFQFSTNVKLPIYLGLGKGVSHGYGVIKPLNQ